MTDTQTTDSSQVTAFTGDIPLTVAVQAYGGVSFSPERRGQSTVSDYSQMMAEDYADFKASAEKGGTLDLLDELFATYRARVSRSCIAYLHSSSRCVSWMIAGPSNFPVARMQKRNEIAHKRLCEWLDGRTLAKARILRKLRPDLAPIMAGDADAVERLLVDINEAERLQARMKAVNAAITKNRKAGLEKQLEALGELGYSREEAEKAMRPDCMGCIGFPSYRLTNNGANIRRMKQRVEQIQRARARPVVDQVGTNGIRLQDDPPANRIRLFFDGKPASDIRDKLKKNGFRWTPSLEAWQAYRNSWSIQLAQTLAGVA